MKNFQEITFHIMQQKRSIMTVANCQWDFSTAEMAENAQTDKTDSQHLKVSYWEATP